MSAIDVVRELHNAALRAVAHTHVSRESTLYGVAAKEIESLRARVAELEAELMVFEEDDTLTVAAVNRIKEENERLRADQAWWQQQRDLYQKLTDEMNAKFVDMQATISALESREVCTVAHDGDVVTCGYCQRDALRAEVERLAGVVTACHQEIYKRDTENEQLRADAGLGWKVALELCGQFCGKRYAGGCICTDCPRKRAARAAVDGAGQSAPPAQYAAGTDSRCPACKGIGPCPECCPDPRQGTGL